MTCALDFTNSIRSEDCMSKFERKFEEFEEIGKVDDDYINDNFDEVDKVHA